MKVPEARIYEKDKWAENTMRAYAAILGRKHFKKCSYIKCHDKRLHTHHINHDRWDNRLDNLVPMCPHHHHAQHPSWNKGLTKKTDKRMKHSHALKGGVS